jgi:hypothetical protein
VAENSREYIDAASEFGGIAPSEAEDEAATRGVTEGE